MKRREEVLLFLLTVSAVTRGSNINFNDTFFNVLGEMATEIVIFTLLTAVVYTFITKPLYKFITK